VHGHSDEPLEEIPPTGAAFQGVARRSRRTPAAVVVAGIAVLALALLTKATAPPSPTPSAGVAPVASAVVALGPSPVATTSSPTSTPSPTLGPPDHDPDATPFPAFLAAAAMVGQNELIPAGGTSVRFTMTVPSGWARAGEGMYVKDGGVAPAGMSISAWRPEEVLVYPCRWASGVIADPTLMRTPAGEVAALSGWWGQDPGGPPNSNASIAPIASRPRPSAIAGFPATTVDVLTLVGFDFSSCDGGQLVFWGTPDGSVRYGLGAGELQRLSVVELGGEVLVIDAASFPADLVELQSMVDSIAVEP